MVIYTQGTKILFRHQMIFLLQKISLNSPWIMCLLWKLRLYFHIFLKQACIFCKYTRIWVNFSFIPDQAKYTAIYTTIQLQTNYCTWIKKKSSLLCWEKMTTKERKRTLSWDITWQTILYCWPQHLPFKMAIDSHSQRIQLFLQGVFSGKSPWYSTDLGKMFISRYKSLFTFV